MAALQGKRRGSGAGRSRPACEPTPAGARIAIIGGGPSGLTAALTLKKQGYANVTVFEANAEVGGKVKTVVHDGRPYEMGAIWFDKPYATILALMKEYGIRSEPCELPVILEQGRCYTQIEYAREKFGLAGFSLAVLQFLRAAHTRFAGAGEQGFTHVDRALHREFDRFTRNYDRDHLAGIGPVVEVLRPFLVGCGYGYFETTPAMYYFKLAPWIVQRSSLAQITGAPLVHRVADGWQSMWRVIAADLPDVRVATPVTRVERSGAGVAGIHVTAGGITKVFDRLIVTPNPDVAGAFMDFTPIEQDLFARVRYLPLAVTLMTGGGLPHAFLKDNQRPASIGHVVTIGKVFPSADVYTFYQNLPEGMTREQAMALLHADVAALGGHVDAVIARDVWNYFPHVSTANADAGFYHDLEALQGDRATYYVNSLVAFEDVEHTAAYARELVEQRFRRVWGVRRAALEVRQ